MVAYDYLSGSAICGNNYYAIWDDINNGNTGITRIDLATGNYSSK